MAHVDTVILSSGNLIEVYILETIRTRCNWSIVARKAFGIRSKTCIAKIYQLLNHITSKIAYPQIYDIIYNILNKNYQNLQFY